MARPDYGRVRLGDIVDLIKRSTITGDGILYVAVMLHSGEIDEIEQHYFGDQIVRVEESASPIEQLVAPMPEKKL